MQWLWKLPAIFSFGVAACSILLVMVFVTLIFGGVMLSVILALIS